MILDGFSPKRTSDSPMPGKGSIRFDLIFPASRDFHAGFRRFRQTLPGRRFQGREILVFGVNLRCGDPGFPPPQPEFIPKPTGIPRGFAGNHVVDVPTDVTGAPLYTGNARFSASFGVA